MTDKFTGVPREGHTPTESSEFFLIVCSQNNYTVQALVLCTLNPKFCTQKTLKIVC